MRRRIAVLVAATTTLVLVAFLIPLAVLVRTVAFDRAVNTATTEAQALTSVVGTVDRSTLELSVQRANAQGRFPLTVFLRDGTVLGAEAERTPAVRLAARGRSLTVDTDSGVAVLVSVGDSSGGQAVIRSEVGERELMRGVHRAWLLLAGLGVVLLGLSVLVADRLARSLVRPTRELSEVSHRLANGELDARARVDSPREMRDVATALNHLAGRIRELLAAEREYVADLSHRLRTPLMSLRLDAEALRDRQESERITEHVDTLHREVTRIIEQAGRRSSARSAPSGCDAVAVVSERVEFWSVLAEDTEREMRVDLAPGPLRVALEASELSDCVDALLGNVFAHTEDGVGFDVRLFAHEGFVRLVVSDDGAGFGESVASGEPLSRGASGSGSTGIGLDIVRRAADESGGSVTLGTGERGGARVTVDFGVPEG
ncbi:sensor histidine kinase [Actinopolyspora mortivallis]|uniref:Signal transduction histidine-protein kinase/phosphatase MprB n=1 Tax=Actinopolyspora mortivallis TaxID=33906 RepID=A0A2T0GYP6_ACTMO|nr:HAMP domain-containing sensor histidine kinase [Actinopolyspora mortivallis]PRW64229.1 two-component sensor histidine kinase [Actinopolyspora mortivallis]